MKCTCITAFWHPEVSMQYILNGHYSMVIHRHIIVIQLKNLRHHRCVKFIFTRHLRAIDFGNQKGWNLLEFLEFLKVVAYDSTIGPHDMYICNYMYIICTIMCNHFQEFQKFKSSSLFCGQNQCLLNKRKIQ